MALRPPRATNTVLLPLHAPNSAFHSPCAPHLSLHPFHAPNTALYLPCAPNVALHPPCVPIRGPSPTLCHKLSSSLSLCPKHSPAVPSNVSHPPPSHCPDTSQAPPITPRHPPVPQPLQTALRFLSPPLSPNPPPQTQPFRCVPSARHPHTHPLSSPSSLLSPKHCRRAEVGTPIPGRWLSRPRWLPLGLVLFTTPGDPHGHRWGSAQPGLPGVSLSTVRASHPHWVGVKNPPPSNPSPSTVLC